MKISLIKTVLFFSLIVNLSPAQTFLNGSFETNSAGASDQINLSNATFNAMMPDVNSFGTNGNMDIIQSTTWGGGGAQHCKWYVALTGGGTDAITLKLSAPLVTGTTYTMSFWDRKDVAFPGTSIEVGLSTTNSNVGSVIYTAPASVNNTWTQRTFTFIAPNNGDYVSVVQSGASSISEWVQIDNFTLNNNGTGVLTLASSANPICSGSSAVFTVTGGGSYTWTPSGSLSSANGSVVTASPLTTTVYTVNASAGTGTCIYTASYTLGVIPQVSVVLTPSIICAGNATTLTATGSASYSWTPSTGLSNTTGSIVIASPGVSTNYSVTGGTGTCISIATASVQIKPAPQLSVTGSPGLVCKSEKRILSVSGAANYTWSPGAIFTSTLLVNTQSTGTLVYTAIGQHTNGCTASKNFTVTVQNCNDLKEVTRINIELFPNPSTGEFTITCELNVDLSIFSSSGALVMEVALAGDSRSVQIGPLAPGVYFVVDKTSSIRKRIVISR